MLVFTTKIPLKSDVTAENIYTLIKQWLTSSPHYNIFDITYSFEEEKVLNTSDHTKLFF